MFHSVRTTIRSRLVSWQESYEYTPLADVNAIRILELSPGSGNDPLQGSLRRETLGPYRERCSPGIRSGATTLYVSSQLNSRPFFEALSYMWGDDTCVEKIRVDGHFLKITQNLSDALRRVRLPDKSRRVWADGICINQNDVRERTQQVSLMGELYRRAECVLVWIGKEKRSSVHALSFVKAVAPIIAHLQPNGHWGPGIRPSAINNPAGWRSLSRLSHQPWFARAWVQQEIGVATHALAYYGSESCPWSALTRVIKAVFDDTDIAFTAEYQILTDEIFLREAEFRAGANSCKDFLEVLQLNRKRQCKDSKDKIFAFLGHPSACMDGKTIIVPDYSKSTADIYHELARTMFERDESLQFLATIEHRPVSAEYPAMTTDDGQLLPSWVPRWDMAAMSPLLGDQEMYRSFKAAGVSQVQASNEISRQFKVRGVRVDCVAYVTRPLKTADFARPPFTPPESSAVHDMWQNIIAARGRGSYITGGTDLQAFGASLVFPHAVNIYTGEKWDQYLLDFAAFCRLYKECGRVLDDEAIGEELLSEFTPEERRSIQSLSLEKLYDRAYQFSCSATISCEGRRHFYTAKGYFGNGPYAMRHDLGDIVCILFGLNVPVVLKPVGENQFWFAGACYIPGLMYGEAMELLEKGELKEDEFILI